jgi:hypothetical protein
VVDISGAGHQHDRAAVKVIVIATDEELEVARQSLETIKAVIHEV